MLNSTRPWHTVYELVGCDKECTEIIIRRKYTDSKEQSDMVNKAIQEI